MIRFAVNQLMAASLILLISGALLGLDAKPDPKREDAFQTIASSFQSNRWEESLLLIERFQSRYPHSDREASLLVMSAECNLKLRRLNAAEVLASEIILKYPEAEFVGRARLTLGECALLSGDWERAEFNLAWIVSFSSDTVSLRIARDRLEELHEYLAAKERAEVKSSAAEIPKVALLLPLSGGMAVEAGNFLNGFRYTWGKSEFGDPYLFDSENDAVKAVRLYREIARNHSPWIVIGGLTAAEATGLAAYSQTVQVPFLTTSCGDDGLASLSQYAIQGRADYGGLAASLGRFASINMGLRHLAIFYVNNVIGRRMAKEFREQVERNGGIIQGEASFYPSTIDFSNNLLQLKSQLIRANFDDSLNSEFAVQGHLLLNSEIYIPADKDLTSDTLPAIDGGALTGSNRLSKTFLDSLWSAERRTRRWKIDGDHENDSASIELPGLEGIFVVIEAGTIEMIAPQLTRYRLNRQIFGDENWDNREALRKVNRYVNGIIYANPLAPTADSTAGALNAAVMTQGDKNLGRYHFAGERAASIVLEAIQRAGNQKAFRDALTTLNGVPTLSGRVTFVKEERIDKSQALILYKDGVFTTIGDR